MITCFCNSTKLSWYLFLILDVNVSNGSELLLSYNWKERKLEYCVSVCVCEIESVTESVCA